MPVYCSYTKSAVYLVCWSIYAREEMPQNVHNHRSELSFLMQTRQILQSTITTMTIKRCNLYNYTNENRVKWGVPSSPHPIYKEVIPIASRAAMKLPSRVSSRTMENIPSNMLTNSSPCSSYRCAITSQSLPVRKL